MSHGLAISGRKKSVSGYVLTTSRHLAIIAAIALLASVATIAQNPEVQQKFAAAEQAAALNKQRLHQYQWTETTQVTLNGDQKPPTEQPSGGRLKQRVIEKKKAEMADYMDDVKGVLSMYVPPDPDKMQLAFQAGKVSINPAGSVLNIVFTNYAQPGDSMTLVFDPAIKKIISLSVNTYMGQAKDVVTLQVQMAGLPDGTGYPQQTILNATAKNLVVTTTNSNYQKMGGY